MEMRILRQVGPQLFKVSVYFTSKLKYVSGLGSSTSV